MKCIFNHARVIDYLSNFFNEKNDLFICGSWQMKIFFAYGPRDSEVLRHSYKHIREHGETPPPPAERVVREIKQYNPDIVLFFGIAGGINAGLNKIYFPTRFYEYYFDKPHMIHTQNVSPSREIRIKNLLGNDNVRVLTTNFAFSKHSTGAGEDMNLWSKIWSQVERDLKENGLSLHGKQAADKWAELKFYNEFLPRLKSFGDLIDMESYAFARAFKNKIGIMLQVSDVIGEIDLTFEREHVDWEKFNQSVVKSIKEITS